MAESGKHTAAHRREPADAGTRGRTWRLLGLAAVPTALMLLYVGDLLATSGEVPRGVTAATRASSDERGPGACRVAPTTGEPIP